jgi:catechol 2,3-dioxygenase-like lactoylglutathione lyase family enzyme
MMKLEHIALTVLSHKEISDFYHDILGFEIVKEFELNQDLSEKIFNISTTAQIFFMKKNDLFFEIFVGLKITKIGYNHICLSLSNREKIYKKAIALGYSTIRIARDTNDIIFLKDKSGNLFEIKEIL